jgi:hypothetical protein
MLTRFVFLSVIVRLAGICRSFNILTSAPDFLRVENPKISTIRDSPVRHHNNTPCSRNVSSAMRIHRPTPPISLISKPTTAASTTAATTTTTTTTATTILATAYRVVVYVVCNDAIYCQ